MKRPPTLKEIARKYKIDYKKMEDMVLGFGEKLPDGINTIIQKNIGIKIVNALNKPGIGINTIDKSVDDEGQVKDFIPIFKDDILKNSKIELKDSINNKIFLHEEVYNSISKKKELPEQLRSRITLLLRQFLAYGKPTSVIKGTSQKWRRTPIGGLGKFHYYLWWAPKGAPPVKEIDCDDGSIFIRQIREHDNHGELNCGDINVDYYPPISAKELIKDKETFIEPWTEQQMRFCNSEEAIRILNGSPGSGKTTALWNAINLRSKEKVLYITRSKQLSIIAQDYLDIFSSKDSTIICEPFYNLVKQLQSGEDDNNDFYEESIIGSYKLFNKAIGSVPDNILGIWKDYRYSLWTIIRAYLIGYALPSNRHKHNRPRLNDDDFENIKISGINSDNKKNILEIVKFIEKESPIEDFFKDLKLAFNAAINLFSENELPGYLKEINRIVIDEVQDLTKLEILIPIFLAKNLAKINKENVAPFLLFAGDSSQTVVPTEFKWGSLKDLLTKYLNKNPNENKLAENVRSPENISNLINKAASLYSNVSKENRPKGDVLKPTTNESTIDLIYYCKTKDNNDLKDLLSDLANEPGLAIVYLGNEPPEYFQKDEVLETPETIKGRDIQKVCILDASKHLSKIKEEIPWYKSEKDDPIWKKTLIDRFRVSISRSTEVLIFIDVDSNDSKLEVEKFLEESEVIFSPIEVNEILNFLHEDDPDEIVRKCIKDSEDSFDSNPNLAWRRAQQAVGRLGEINKPGSVTDESLRKEAWISCMKTSLSISVLQKSTEEKIRILEIGSNSAKEAGQKEFAELYKLIIESVSDSVDMNDILRISQILENLKKTYSWLRIMLEGEYSLNWKKQFEKLAKERKQDENRLITILKELPDLYENIFIKDSKDSANKTIINLSEFFIEENNYKKALNVLNLLEIPQNLLLAKCYKGSGDFKEAAQYFEKSQQWKSALECYRELAMVDDALRCIENLPGSPDIKIIKWLKQLTDVLDDKPANNKLTKGEFDKIKSLISNLN